MLRLVVPRPTSDKRDGMVVLSTLLSLDRTESSESDGGTATSISLLFIIVFSNRYSLCAVLDMALNREMSAIPLVKSAFAGADNRASGFFVLYMWMRQH